MPEPIHLGTFSITDWHNSLVAAWHPKSFEPSSVPPLRDIPMRHLFDQIRNYARTQSAGKADDANAHLDWAERVTRERWSVDVIWQTGEVETLVFDGAFGYPVNIKLNKAKERFK